MLSLPGMPLNYFGRCPSLPTPGLRTGFTFPLNKYAARKSRPNPVLLSLSFDGQARSRAPSGEHAGTGVHSHISKLNTDTIWVPASCSFSMRD